MIRFQNKHFLLAAGSILVMLPAALLFGLLRLMRLHWLGFMAGALLVPVSAMCIWMALWVWPRPAVETYAAAHHRKHILIVMLSGDLGFHGATKKAAVDMVAQGYDLVTIDSRAWFHGYQPLSADAARLGHLIDAQTRSTGDTKVVLGGISFGADIIPFIAPRLPPTVQQNIIGFALVVPGTHAYFQTDWHEHLEWGGITRATQQSLLALPADHVACVYGTEETDSACPGLDAAGARILGLPGGHLLNGKTKSVSAFLVSSFAAHAPAGKN